MSRRRPQDRIIRDIVNDFCVVVSGLPASGKSTIGAKLAQELDIRLLDKDDYLEALFEKRGVGDANWRQLLSRESDENFRRDAIATNSAVLVSHWRPRGSGSSSGTPTEWITESFPMVVELYCDCSAEMAKQRFLDRKRHPGHLDGRKNREELLVWMREYREQLPLSIGELLCVDACSDLDIKEVTKQLIEVISRLKMETAGT